MSPIFQLGGSEFMRSHIRFCLLIVVLAFTSAPIFGADKPFGESFARAEMLAQQGDAEGQYQLGKHFDYGWGIQRDGIKAAVWYEKAANQGHVEAQHALGLLNTPAGNYAFANLEVSVRWFRAAAEQGHPSSQHFLGKAYEEGKGVPRNYEEAALWYQRAAAQGDGMAMHGLATLYARGLGVEKDLVKAYAWNNVSATQGWGMSVSYRTVLEQQMTWEQLKEGQRLSLKLNEKHGKEPKK